ncbi:cyclin-dependent kinase B1-1-like isoform X1 [Curcuma longa]|uniref:cyclin-dependent kinase B1-1-like isoform X1 n=1 Tax=Curcuma longa TaxID=136217 RepID=UPI003D9F7860
MDDYQKLEKIGEGAYGKVYKAQDKKTGQLVAIKKSRLQMDAEGIHRTTLREISLLQYLSQSIYISFMYQLCKGVTHCHSHGVLHRDLKPQNLLVDKEKGILKIADLGLGRAFSIPLKCYTHEVVTLGYRAPEILLGATHYSTGVDVWSVGCIFAEMARSKALFIGQSELHQLLCIFRLLGTPTEETWPGVSSLRDWHSYPQWRSQDLALVVPSLEPEGIDLLSKMLEYDPAKRISALKAMDHPYFNSLDKSQF